MFPKVLCVLRWQRMARHALRAVVARAQHDLRDEDVRQHVDQLRLDRQLHVQQGGVELQLGVRGDDNTVTELIKRITTGTTLLNRSGQFFRIGRVR